MRLREAWRWMESAKRAMTAFTFRDSDEMNSLLCIRRCLDAGNEFIGSLEFRLNQSHAVKVLDAGENVSFGVFAGQRDYFDIRIKRIAEPIEVEPCRRSECFPHGSRPLNENKIMLEKASPCIAA